MSASTRKESALSEMDDEMMAEDHDYPEEELTSKRIRFKFGDKFTKKPLQYRNNLVLLGRTHIQILDLETFETKFLSSVGED